MLTLATGLFGMAVLTGIWMGVIHMESEGRRRPPQRLAAAHGIAALAGFAFLAAVILNGSARGRTTGSSSFDVIAAVCFAAAALVGFYLFVGRHRRGRRLPGVVIAGHMMLAVTGFVVLLVYLSFP